MFEDEIATTWNDIAESRVAEARRFHDELDKTGLEEVRRKHAKGAYGTFQGPTVDLWIRAREQELVEENSRRTTLAAESQAVTANWALWVSIAATMIALFAFGLSIATAMKVNPGPTSASKPTPPRN